MKPGPRGRLTPWQVAYIEKAYRVRRKLTTKAMARRLGVPLNSVRHAVENARGLWGVTS